MTSVTDYFRQLSERFGDAWNRFWLAPGDPIALCAIRVIVGILAICWYLSHSLDLTRLYGPDGLLPPDVIRSVRVEYGFSYLDYITTPAALWIVYWLGLAAYVAFTLGIFTRISAVLALIVTLSMLWRVPMLAGPGEHVLAMLQFYLCLGPAGDCLSLDARRRARSEAQQKRLRGDTADVPRRHYLATIALKLIQLHVVAIYAMMIVGQIRSGLWWSGEAMLWLIDRPDDRLVNLSRLRDQTYLLNAWTLAIFLYEVCFVVLVWNRTARPLLLALSLLVWIPLALVTGEVLLSLLMLAANLAFVSPDWLRGVLKRQ